jgi:Raf kinase inhibitor-like YbhB/YbcL family protein
MRGMKRRFVLAGLCALALEVVGAPMASAQQMDELQVTSTSFGDGDYIPELHVLGANTGLGCSGGNVSPQLAWSGAPDGTKSFAVTAFDPDAPTGSGFWHWVVVNIPPDVSELPAGAGSGQGLPAGALQTRTDFGTPAYGGPCPPMGDHPHRYIFTVFAVGVDQLQQVAPDTSAAIIGFMLHFNTLAKGELEGLYKH